MTVFPRLDAVDMDALRIDAGHYVLDRIVFPGPVHRLEENQERVRARNGKDVRRGHPPCSQTRRKRRGIQLGKPSRSPRTN
jgi:hypothetical protein